MWHTGQDCCKVRLITRYCDDQTYAIFIVNLVNPLQGFCSTHDGDCLDRDTITKASTLAVDDTWDVDVCADAELLASFDDSVVGTYSLRGEASVAEENISYLSGHHIPSPSAGISTVPLSESHTNPPQRH
jgi:hypothetical protein